MDEQKLTCWTLIKKKYFTRLYYNEFDNKYLLIMLTEQQYTNPRKLGNSNDVEYYWSEDLEGTAIIKGITKMKNGKVYVPEIHKWLNIDVYFTRL